MFSTISRLIKYSVIIISLVAISGCGSSSNDGFFGAAFVEVDASPNSIDIGDATFVTVRVEDVDDDSIFLKVRFPEGLSYLRGSGQIRVGGEEFSREPDLVFSQEEENKNFIVFFLSRQEFQDRDESIVSFDLVGISRVSESDIEVDPDIDDPNIDNQSEISFDDPKFQSEDSVRIQVR